MAEVIVRKTIDAPIEKVFSIWNDEFADIYKYHPGLKKSYLLDQSPTTTGIGAMRHCEMSDGKNWIREKVIRAIENKQIVLDIYEGTMPLKSAVGTFNFTKVQGNKTEITMIMQFTPKMGFIGKLLTPLMKSKFRPMLQSLLDSNADYAENGVQVNKTIHAH